MMRLFFRFLMFTATISATGLLPTASQGAMLDKVACASLTQELANLKLLDVDRLMEKGPEWAVANLSTGDMSIVRKYIELDEQVKFRCLPPSSLVTLQGPPEDEDASAKPASGTVASKKPGEQKEEGSEAAPKNKRQKNAAKGKPPRAIKASVSPKPIADN